VTRHKLDDSIWNKIYAYLKITPSIYTGNEDKSHSCIHVVHWKKLHEHFIEDPDLE